MIVSFVDINGSYLRFGPNQDLIIISILIDSWFKYFILLFIISTINVIKVISEDIGMPILSFNIYNPDKKVITDFTKFELKIMANVMYTVCSIRELFLILVTISQIDVALFDVIIKGLASLYTIELILKEKKFEIMEIQNDLEIPECNILIPDRNVINV
jgi:hypothetical protein